MSNLGRFSAIFGSIRPIVVAMVHVNALPGTPKHCLTVDEIVERCCRDVETYKGANVDAILVENMHDVPYNCHPDIGAEAVACMTRVCVEVRRHASELPCGVQVLAAGNIEALAVAKASGCQFVRTEGFVFGHVADEGLMNACAGPLMRYRRSIQADDILVFTDIKKKHSSHAITADVDIVQTAKAAQFFLSDGVIVTGMSTGYSANTQDTQSVLNAVDIPVFVGSGVTASNVHDYMSLHGLIVGSHFKLNNRWENEVSFDKVVKFMAHVQDLRRTRGTRTGLLT